MDADPGAFGETGESVDDRAETAHRVVHPLVEVEGAHEVIDRRCPARVGAEEDGRVLEDLPQTRIGHGSLGPSAQALREQAGQGRNRGQERTVEDGERRGERVVEEEPLGHRLRMGGRAQMGLQAPARAGLAVLEDRDDSVPSQRDTHRCRLGGDARRGRRVRVGEHGVGGIEGHEVELNRRARAHEREEVVVDLGHEIPGRARIEAEPVPDDPTDAPAHLGVLLEDVDTVTVSGEQGGGGESCGTRPDDAHLRHHELRPRRVPRVERARRRALTWPGMRIRSR